MSFGSDNFIADRNDLTLKWGLVCLMIGALLSSEKMMFGITGENLTASVRVDLMKGMLFKQLCWFDSEKRAPGILTSIMSENVTSLNGMTTETIAIIVETFLGMILGLLVSCYFSWRMALTTIALSPVMAIGVVAMSKL